MIRINLLPPEKRPRISTLRLDLGALVFALVLVGGAILLSHLWVSAKLSDLERVHEARQVENRALTAEVAQVRRMENEIKAVASKIEIITGIRSIQTLPVRYIDALISLLPEDRIWFETFQLDHNGALQLKGVAMDNQSFAAYVEILRTSDFVRGVVTERTLRREVQGLTLVEFHFRITFGPPPDEYYQREANYG
ncbi:type IV pilus assembly protein PilN [Desulfonatronum thiosulfatophilum]|uniref:Type IV pilus assembly protein PilN n=1 Tax=Desulfonatronum thiosulfatophilum TaxID=617002 RepID=A0A1G6ED05_9BACT|nr:PilN domain-containing protein [Desulfonatronum thiosulfatophilum]SDB55293.1 type IV pilus assembly protein PilN [Desulfonatronum thiosulfatophilum]